MCKVLHSSGPEESWFKRFDWVTLGNALKILGIDEESTECALINIAEQNGMNGTMQRSQSWVFGQTHHLELTCKDALSSQLFTDVTEMLLRFYISKKKICTQVQDSESAIALLCRIGTNCTTDKYIIQPTETDPLYLHKHF